MRDIEIGDLTETELAMIDAMKAMMEAMMISGLTTARNLEITMAGQQQGYLSKHLLRGATVFEVLLHYVRSEEHEEARQQFRRLLSARPEGSA